MNLSLVIITLNEEDTIARCIGSVPFAGEVIVVDSGSTDSTVSAAASCGAEVLFHEFQSFSTQKQWAIQQASGDWVLSLDADEYLSGDLSCEISSIMKGEQLHSGFSLPFRIKYMGRLMRFGPWSGERHVRLFRNGHASFPDSGVHEALEVSGGTIGELKTGCVIHESYSSVNDQMEKMLQYSTLWAEMEFGKGRRSGPLQILFRPAWRFLSAYFIRGGFLEGLPGFAGSIVTAYYVFLKWMILYERKHLE
ncbi:MAG: glycosyltransferase family 2 protein [Candidatus Fermentibacteria bacterium]